MKSNKIMTFIFFLCCLVLFVACGNSRQPGEVLEESLSLSEEDDADASVRVESEDDEFEALVRSMVNLSQNETIEKTEWIEENVCYRVAVERVTVVEGEYKHLADYIFVKNETVKCIKVTYPSKLEAMDADRYVFDACGFEVKYEDISFDGHKDIVISLGHQGAAGTCVSCAYVFENGDFVYVKTFEDIPNYSINDAQKCIDGSFEDKTFKYQYINGEFVELKQDIPDANDVNWDELLKVPAEEAAGEANPEHRMAHNIYADPDLSTTSGAFDGFMIDFKADQAGTATYWALCNWQMNKADLMSKYEVIDVYAGAYAGLQMRPDGPKAIMSFWEIKYIDESGNEKKIEAKRVYPSGGDTNKFGGEGEGSNYICDYQWEEGKWYRMYLNCYRDEDGRTFVEQWVADLSTEEWTLISRFDTGLYHSYFEGGMSQFMENYDGDYANETRTFEYRNICVREYGQEVWTYILTADLSIDTWWDNKKGNAFYGATKDRFYGIANGYGPDAFEMNEVVRDIYTIK